LLAPIALILTLAAPAAAQTETAGPYVSTPVQAGAWTVTPLLALSFGGQSDTSSLGFGGALGYDFTDLLSFEGELGYLFDLIGDDDFADWSVTTFSGNALLHFPLENGSAPYATAGVTLARSHREISDTVEDTAKFGFNFGGGIKHPLTDRIAARGDIRYFKYNDAGPDGFRVYGGVIWRLGR
jgi:opacity protein-like surface antigen